MSIVLHLILGQVNEHYVKYALDNCADFIDVAVINNNGSNDLNKKRVFESKFALENRMVYFESEFKDFSQARNLCFENTPLGSWDWVMKLDADEVHYPDRIEEIISILPSVTQNVVKVPFWHLLSWRVYQEFSYTSQFFRYNANLSWQGRVHETLLCGAPFFMMENRLAMLHYSYTLSQPEIYGKWTQYSILEGDPEHYTRKNTDPNHLLEDRYAMSGAPFFDEHPPGAKEYIASEMRRRNFHDVPLPTGVCIYGRDSEALVKTAASVRASINNDYPFSFILLPERGSEGDWQWLREQLSLTGDLLPPLDAGYSPEVVHYRVGEHAALRPDLGHFLFLRAGTTFQSGGWLKALVNASYCLFDCFDAYQPGGAKETVLVPRDVVGLHPDLLRKYESPFCLVDEQ